MHSAQKGPSGPLWLFGYGSLIFRPDFPFTRRCRAFIRGLERRFHQGSTDHRGVPSAPGRVVTLVEREGASCWGVAYEVSSTVRDHVLGRLDVREKGGYERRAVRLHLRPTTEEAKQLTDGEVDGVVYFAAEGNINHLGPASLGEMAAQIARSVGPSGANSEYLFKLAAALRALDVDDPHVFELERSVRDVL